MANVYDIEAKKELKSVHTPTYENNPRYLINPIYPNCDKKYYKVVDYSIVEMNQLEKNIIDAEIVQTELDNKWIQIRNKRDFLLTKSDWTQMSDSPLSEEKKTEWVDYRSILRNIPQDYDNPDEVIWEDKPGD